MLCRIIRESVGAVPRESGADAQPAAQVFKVLALAVVRPRGNTLLIDAKPWALEDDVRIMADDSQSAAMQRRIVAALRRARKSRVAS
jgi:hypothetical protein